MAQKFLHGIDISGNLTVDSHSAVGSTVFDIQGSQGQLFSITNSLSGDLFSVSDISGVPIFNVNSSGLVTVDGDIHLGANKIGRDTHNFIDFSIDNHITFKTAQSTAVQIDSNLSLKVIAGSLQISGDNANFVTLTESGSGDFTIDAPDDIRLDAGGGDIVLKDDGSEYGRLSNSSQDFIIKNITENKDIKFEGNDGNGTSGVNITALKLDMSDNGWAHFSGGIAVGTGTSTFAGAVSATEFRPTNIVTNKVVKFNGTQLDDSSITDTGSQVSTGSQIKIGSFTDGSNNSGEYANDDLVIGDGSISIYPHRRGDYGLNETGATSTTFRSKLNIWSDAEDHITFGGANTHMVTAWEEFKIWINNDSGSAGTLHLYNKSGKTEFAKFSGDGTSSFISGKFFVNGELEATSLDINGNADISGTLDVGAINSDAVVTINPGSNAVSTIKLRRDTTGDNTIVGDVEFDTTAAQGTDDRIALIRAQTSAGDGTSRGGEMKLYTRQSGSANFNTTRYTKDGNWLFPGEVEATSLDINGAADISGALSTGDKVYVNQGADLTTQALQVNGFIDITDVTATALRWYNGSTFRGGLGLDSWAHSGLDADITMYISGDNSFHVSTNNVKRVEVDSTGLIVTGGLDVSGDADISGALVVGDSVHWDLSAGEYSGDPRAVVSGYSGGNYGQLGYNIAYTSTSGSHNRVFNDIPTRIDLHNGIVVYASAAGSAGSAITWTEVLEAQTDAFQYKGQDIYHSGNNSAILNSNVTSVSGSSGSCTGNAATATNSTQLNGFTLARIDNAEAFHTFTGIVANGAQAKRYHIGRLYGCPAHWDGNWQNMEINVTAESYESGHLRYRLMGDYGGAGTQAGMIDLYLKEASGDMVSRFRFVLGTPVDAGWDHSNQDTFYVDLYAEAAHYSQWEINIKTYGHGTQNTNPTSGGATTVLYDSPTVSNISTFSEGHTTIKHLNNEIYHEGHKPTLSELGAAPIASPTFTGTPAAPTATAATSTTQIATTAFVTTAVSNLVDSAPSTLNTLDELALALGDDANFATTIATSIGNKLPLAGGTMTGDIQMSANKVKFDQSGTRSWNIFPSSGNLNLTSGDNVGNFDVGMSLIVKNALIDNASVTSATTTTVVASISGSTYAAVFFDYVAYKSSNIRAGIVTACSDGTTVSFSETSTTDLGDTSDVTLSVDISGGNFRLLATTTSSTWNIKSLIRAI